MFRLWHRFREQVTQVRQGPLFGYPYRVAGDSLPAMEVTYRGMFLLKCRIWYGSVLKDCLIITEHVRGPLKQDAKHAQFVP